MDVGGAAGELGLLVLFRQLGDDDVDSDGDSKVADDEAADLGEGDEHCEAQLRGEGYVVVEENGEVLDQRVFEVDECLDRHVAVQLAD